MYYSVHAPQAAVTNTPHSLAASNSKGLFFLSYQYQWRINGLLFYPVVSLLLRAPDFSTRNSEWEREREREDDFTMRNFRGQTWLMHMAFLLLFHYPEIKSIVPRDYHTVLTLSPGKRLSVAINILCKKISFEKCFNRFQLELCIFFEENIYYLKAQSL